MPKHLIKTLAAPALLLSPLSAKDTVGGQALIEGIMMRGKEKIAWAVRKPDGEAVIESFPFVSVTKKVAFLGLPIIRGVVGLFESMRWGYRALSRSADIAMDDADGAENSKKSSIKDQLFMAASFVLAFAISISLFMYAPMWLANRIPYIKDTPMLFNLTAGAVRIGLLLIYMMAISLWSETRRLFEYHGAEHKTIFAYEDGKPLTVDNIEPYTTVHPRCGTSFLVLVAICGILMSSVIDTLHIQYIGDYANLFHRFGIRLVFIPLLAGVSFEALKLSAKYRSLPIVGWIIQPGLLVQRIT
ncbi:MAG: DUF1385 domain-containing protein, partial [Chitinispirillales bacterium]|nr:DUF1385 domain-containing protein [Chitinispirillales bacterium]